MRDARRRARGDGAPHPATLPLATTAGPGLATLAWMVVALGALLVGVAYRFRDFGHYGFWTDEVWVALGTRVEGWSQWWLALSVTPIGWAGLLRALAAAPGRPEVVLRLLPPVASSATLLVVYRLG